MPQRTVAEPCNRNLPRHRNASPLVPVTGWGQPHSSFGLRVYGAGFRSLRLRVYTLVSTLYAFAS